MKRPINFERINDLTFNYDGNDYIIQIYNQSNWLDSVYIHNSDALNGYCLKLELDWNYQTIQITRCIDNQGPNGLILNKDITFSISEVKNMDIFIFKILRTYLQHHIAQGTFKN